MRLYTVQYPSTTGEEASACWVAGMWNALYRVSANTSTVPSERMGIRRFLSIPARVPASAPGAHAVPESHRARHWATGFRYGRGASGKCTPWVIPRRVAIFRFGTPVATETARNSGSHPPATSKHRCPPAGRRGQSKSRTSSPCRIIQREPGDGHAAPLSDRRPGPRGPPASLQHRERPIQDGVHDGLRCSSAQISAGEGGALTLARRSHGRPICPTDPAPRSPRKPSPAVNRDLPQPAGGGQGSCDCRREAPGGSEGGRNR